MALSPVRGHRSSGLCDAWGVVYKRVTVRPTVATVSEVKARHWPLTSGEYKGEYPGFLAAREPDSGRCILLQALSVSLADMIVEISSSLA